MLLRYCRYGRRGQGRGGVDLCFSHSGALLSFVLRRADATLHSLPHPSLLQRGSGVGLLLPRDPNHTKEREEEKKCLGNLGYLRLSSMFSALVDREFVCILKKDAPS